jgi:ribosomal protein L3 glutamine methyltransferase
MTAETAAELHTIIDLIRYGTSRFNEAGLTFGHSYDNALDEATQLVLHSLHLPHDLGPAYGQARLLQAEKLRVLELFQRRIDERIPAAYLTGEAWFAGLSFKSDKRALVPRSPIAELIECGFEPWLAGRDVTVRWTCAPVRAASPSPWATTTRTGRWTASTSATTRCRWPKTRSACRRTTSP